MENDNGKYSNLSKSSCDARILPGWLVCARPRTQTREPDRIWKQPNAIRWPAVATPGDGRTPVRLRALPRWVIEKNQRAALDRLIFRTIYVIFNS